MRATNGTHATLRKAAPLPKTAKPPAPPKADALKVPFANAGSLLADLIEASVQPPAGTPLSYYGRTGSTGAIVWLAIAGGNAVGVATVDKWMKANGLNRAGVEAEIRARQIQRELRKGR